MNKENNDTKSLAHKVELQVSYSVCTEIQKKSIL